MGQATPLHKLSAGPRIFTHFNVDLDAAVSAWAARRFIPGMSRGNFCFVSGEWDGKELRDQDIAVDIAAGGRGLKGERKMDGMGSCFALIMERYASPQDRGVLKPLIDFVNIQDEKGSVIRYLLPYVSDEVEQMLTLTGIKGVLRALQQFFNGDDGPTVERMSEILDGMLKVGRKRAQDLQELDKVAEILPSGRVAIVRKAKSAGVINKELFRRGVRAIVYVEGMSTGVYRDTNETVRMDAPEIRAVVQAAGEAEEWFAHASGFLYCRGSRKAPAETPSRVDLRALAEAVDGVLHNLPEN